MQKPDKIKKIAILSVCYENSWVWTGRGFRRITPGSLAGGTAVQMKMQVDDLRRQAQAGSLRLFKTSMRKLRLRGCAAAPGRSSAVTNDDTKTSPFYPTSASSALRWA
jgi:hypothetical protein